MKMKFIKERFNIFFVSFGICSFIYLFADSISKNGREIKYLWAVMWLTLLLSIGGGMIFKEGVTYLSLWIRRSIMMLLSIIASTGLVVSLNIISYEKLVIFIPINIIAITIITSILYFIADFFERKNIEKINKKLVDYQDK